MTMKTITAAQNPNYLQEHFLNVNNNDALIRPQTEDDPQRRGQRKFKMAFKELQS
jgi:hypothetical protein